MPETIAPDLLEILVCPACKTKVHLLDNALQCANAECRRRYPVQEGIPVMLIEEARVIEKSLWEQAMGSVGGK